MEKRLQLAIKKKRYRSKTRPDQSQMAGINIFRQTVVHKTQDRISNMKYGPTIIYI